MCVGNTDVYKNEWSTEEVSCSSVGDEFQRFTEELFEILACQ